MLRRIHHGIEIRIRHGDLERYIAAKRCWRETADDLKAFEAVLHSDAFMKGPGQTWRIVARCWNDARHVVPGWPDIEIRLAGRKGSFSLPWNHYPASLKADVDRYIQRLAGHNLLACGSKNSGKSSLPSISMKSSAACECRNLKCFEKRMIDAPTRCTCPIGVPMAPQELKEPPMRSEKLGP